MTRFFFRLLTLLALVDFSLSEWSTDGKAKTFTFATKKTYSNVQMTWFIQREDVVLFLCKNDGIICTPNIDTYLDLYSANITSNSSSYISMFTIKEVNLSLHNTQWFCTADQKGSINSSIEIASFDLYVFAPAESPTCDEVTVLNESNIQINCGTNKVFPASICLFTVKTNVSSEYELRQGYISYTEEQNLTSLYYQTSCTLVVPAAIIGLGSHMFRVVMYPNITSDITEDMRTTSDFTKSIYLRCPKAVLGADCKEQDYIKENITSSCTCYDNNTSFLPTNIKWFTNQTVFPGNGTMVFTTKRKESFQCEISNHLNWTDKTYFQPNISYPPDHVTVNVNNHVFDLCNETNIFIFAICFVTESNPEPSMTLNVNDSLVDITSFKSDRGYIFNNTLSSAGIYYISCLANRMEYSKNVSSKATTVIVKGPPGIPYIFKNENEERKIQGTNLLEITKGDTLTCQAKGGYPILRNISLKCGHAETFATYQNQVTMTFNISNVTYGICECTVWHESNCLQNRSTTVQFMFGVSEKSPFKDQDFDKIYLAVGVTAGCFVSTIALIFIVNTLYQGLLKKTPSGVDDKLVNNEDIYFIKQEKYGIDLSIYPEYTNVVTTMSSAVEAPKNFKK